jgi:hypothetical protein
MKVDIYAKSAQLLASLSNSIYERDPKNPNLVCFSTNEMHVVEKWLRELLKELEEN